jgi:hypothetical protein
MRKIERVFRLTPKVHLMTTLHTIDILKAMRKILSFFGTKIGISLLIFVVIVGLAVFIKNKAPSADKAQKDAATLIVGQIADELLKRENENGQFKTWEELYGTSTSATSSDFVVAPKYTSTDLFSQEIFKQYLAKKQGGEEITDEVTADIAQNVLAKSYPTADGVQTVSEKDIQTVPSTYLNLISYGNTLVKTVTVPLPQGYTKSEMEMLQDIVNDPTLLGELDFQPLVNRYTSIKKNLLAMKVPTEAAKAHANVINAVSNLIFSAEGMANLVTDPIGGIGKTATYEIGANLLDVSFAQINAIFKEKGVRFSPEEAAYPFFI